jgi:molybdopterin/thiamine biosynthesis adenylyltransferase
VLTNEQRERYSRQLRLEGFDEQKQERLLGSKLLVVGAGGLGSAVLLYLAAAGVGELGIVDFDTVSLSDLNRQILYGTADVGKVKVDVARRNLKLLNPGIRVATYEAVLTAGNVREILPRYDLVLECSDNVETKLLVNDACFFLKKPSVIGGIGGLDGSVLSILPGESACYRCVHPLYNTRSDGEQEKRTAAVLGMIPGVIGAVQALEAVRFVALIGDGRRGGLLYFSGTDARCMRIDAKKDGACPLCGDHPVITGA